MSKGEIKNKITAINALCVILAGVLVFLLPGSEAYARDKKTSEIRTEIIQPIVSKNEEVGQLFSKKIDGREVLKEVSSEEDAEGEESQQSSIYNGGASAIMSQPYQVAAVHSGLTEAIDGTNSQPPTILQPGEVVSLVQSGPQNSNIHVIGAFGHYDVNGPSNMLNWPFATDSFFFHNIQQSASNMSTSYITPAAPGDYVAGYITYNSTTGETTPIGYRRVTIVAPSPFNPENFVTIKYENLPGTLPVNKYPVQIGRVFVQGEIANFPQALVNNTPVLTQAEVKNRHADGSVAFALLNFYIQDFAPGDTRTINFQNQTTGNNTGGLTKADMLAMDLDAKTKITIPGLPEQSVSLRDMIASDDFEYWSQGPVATSIRVRAASISKPYNMGAKQVRARLETYALPTDIVIKVDNAVDFVVGENLRLGTKEIVTVQGIAINPTGNGWDYVTVTRAVNGILSPTLYGIITFLSRDQWLQSSDPNEKGLEPVFYVTIWQNPAGTGTGQYKVAYELNNKMTTRLKDHRIANIKHEIGRFTPVQVYSFSGNGNNGYTHSARTFTMKEFWSGNIPPPEVSMDMNLNYMGQTKFIPKYLDLNISQATITSHLNSWNNAQKNYFDAGLLQPGMGAGGLWPHTWFPDLWTALLMQSGDYRLWKVANNRFLAGAWPIYYEEGKPNKWFDRDHTVNGAGRFLSISDNGTLRTGSSDDALQWSGTTLADRIAPVGQMSQGENTWNPAATHPANPFYMHYLMLGNWHDLIHTQELASWVTADHFKRGGSFTNNNNFYVGNRGAKVFNINIRHHGLSSLLVAIAATISPDNTPEKDLLTTWVHDDIEAEEGKQHIANSPYAGSQMYQKAWNYYPVERNQAGPSPVHFADYENPGLCDDPNLNPTEVHDCASPWMTAQIHWSRYWMKIMGFPTDALLQWHAQYIDGLYQSPAIHPDNFEMYRAPTTHANGAPIANWTEYSAAHNFNTATGSANYNTNYRTIMRAAAIAAKKAGYPAAFDQYYTPLTSTSTMQNWYLTDPRLAWDYK